MSGSQTLQSSRRQLTEAERRLLRTRNRDYAARGRRSSSAALPITGGFILVLWVVTLLASDAPWFVVTGFWIVIGAAIALWVGRDMRRHGRQFDAMAQGLESALRRNEAEV